MICSHLEAWGKRHGKKGEITNSSYCGVAPTLDDVIILDNEIIDICLYCEEEVCFIDIRRYKNRRYKNEILQHQTGD